tara:strand:- start:10393 stop:10614 length:222 start_codon:yes stop_codon:yes gene_type:complete
MIYFLIFLTAIIWLNVGILAYKSTTDMGNESLESMVLPLRLVVIILAPIGVLIFERHLFYSKAEPEEILIDKE